MAPLRPKQENSKNTASYQHSKKRQIGSLVGQSAAGCLQTCICNSVITWENNKDGYFLIFIKYYALGLVQAYAQTGFVQSEDITLDCPSLLVKNVRPPFQMGMPIIIQQYKSYLCSHEQLIQKVSFDPNKFCSQHVKQFFFSKCLTKTWS